MTPKEKLNKLISHTLVNLYNRAEPINDKWINEVKFALEDFNKEKLKEQQKENDKLRSLLLTKDLGYFDFTKLLIESKGVITDSGGIQEETSHFGIPCCTLRDNTERPITLVMGSNKLFPIDLINIKDIKKHLNNKFKLKHIPLWDDKVSKRIFKYI